MSYPTLTIRTLAMQKVSEINDHRDTATIYSPDYPTSNDSFFDALESDDDGSAPWDDEEEEEEEEEELAPAPWEDEEEEEEELVAVSWEHEVEEEKRATVPRGDGRGKQESAATGGIEQQSDQPEPRGETEEEQPVMTTANCSNPSAASQHSLRRFRELINEPTRFALFCEFIASKRGMEYAIEAITPAKSDDSLRYYLEAEWAWQLKNLFGEHKGME